MIEHVGDDRQAVAGRNGGNSRNGTRSKTVLTDNAGPVEVEVPRDREGSFEPVIVQKRQRRPIDVDAIVLSLYARGPTTAEISAHFANIYGASVSKDTVSRITTRSNRGPGRCRHSTPSSSPSRRPAPKMKRASVGRSCRRAHSSS